MSELSQSLFETSPSQKNLIGALVSFHQEMGKVAKKSKNPFFRSDYADLPSILDAIKQPLLKNGLVLTHLPLGDNNLMTRLMHESGEYQQGIFYMKSVKDTPQDRGSVITYMMRYAVGAYLGLSIDKDDDGNKGTGNAPKKSYQKKAVSKPKSLAIMTEAIKNTMVDFVKEGKSDLVKSKLGAYEDSEFKKFVVAEILKANDNG